MGKHSGRVAYSIEEAAEVANVDTRVIVAAIKTRELDCRRVNNEPLILRGDIITWMQELPHYYSLSL